MNFNYFKKIIDIIKNNIFILNIVWKSSKVRFLIKTITTILASILPVIKILILKEVISILENFSVRTPEILNRLIFLLIAQASLQFLTKVFFHYNETLIEPFLVANVNKHMNSVLLNKAKLFEYKEFEDPSFYDKYTRAISQSESITHTVFNSFFSFIGSIISISTMFVIVINIDYIILIFLIIGVGLNFSQSLIIGKMNFDTSMYLTPFVRKQNYIKNILYNVIYAKEIQKNDIIGTGQRYYFKSFETILLTLKKYGKRMYFFNITFLFFSNIISFSQITYLLIKVWKGMYKISDYTALMNTSGQLEGNLGAFFENISSLYKNSLEIENLKFIYFYDNNESFGVKSIDYKKPYKIEVRNLSFKYPNSSKYAIKNFNFAIEPGQRVAIVGTNGSGKSTLIKLLIGLYKPSEGSILINGINIEDYKKEDLQKYIGVIFQDFQTFAFTLKENISFEEEISLSTKEVIYKMNLDDKINNLSNKFDTNLSKEFDKEGTLLSGGESQKVCILRALNKKTGFLILDEPTSFLDPLSENNLNDIIFKMTDKTIVFVSHRLTVASKADSVIVINKSEIAEQGTHEQLIKNQGLYFKLYQQEKLKFSLK